MVNTEFPKVDFDVQKGIWEEMAYTIFKVYFKSSVIQYHEQKRSIKLVRVCLNK